MKKSPKKIIKEKFSYIKIPNLYGDLEIYPNNKKIRSYNKQLLRSINFETDRELFKTLKKGFIEYY